MTFEINEALEKIKEETKNNEKHLKGYIYDSLVYRYQLALYKATETEARDLMIRENLSRQEAEALARRNFDQSLIRFCQILDEAIGEHD